MGAEKIKIYGERNTGTNYLRQLIVKNLDADVLNGVVPVRVRQWLKPEFTKDWYFKFTTHSNLGWKHAFPPLERLQRERNLNVVTLTKNPYSWLLSLYKRPYHRKFKPPPSESFSDFLKMSWPSVGRENYSQPKAIFENPVQIWNLKNASYIQLPENIRSLNLRYEDLLQDPKLEFDKIVDHFGLTAREHFENIFEAAKTQDRAKDFNYYRSYYLEELWKEKLNRKDIEIINSFLDRDVTRQFGYEVLSHEDFGD